MDAAYQSGKAIQITRTTAAHAMSYQLTKQLGLAHGHACMLTLPLLWEEMLEEPDMRETLRDLSEKMRLGDPRMGPKILRGILLQMELDTPPLPDAKGLDELAASVNPERLSNHPVSLNREKLREIYQAAFRPLSPMEKKVCLDLWIYY